MKNKYCKPRAVEEDIAAIQHAGLLKSPTPMWSFKISHQSLTQKLTRLMNLYRNPYSLSTSSVYTIE